MLFERLVSTETGIGFENRLIENEDFNIIEYLYFYNGGGVAIGDINNDGLADIFFTSNQQSNKLYLNKGNFRFEDITGNAGVGGAGNWKTGVTMADVNGDGFLDIFVCGVGRYKKFNGRNQLFINNRDLTFSEQSEAFGLAFQGFSTNAAFFDYDRDGDLDMYLLNHSVHTARSYGSAILRNQSDPLAGDKLYRNDQIPEGRSHFTEVTSRAGIYSSQIGYGLGIGISDLNNDGWPDIYVSNDFHENDYLYINQKDGTFIQQLEKSIQHSPRFSMGSDIGDVNNDGWNDIMTLDMQPKEEPVIKTTAGEDPFDIFEFKLRFGYHYQFTRNALQLNRGVDENGQLMFSDIASLAGVESTDWSWSSLFADFDNDGFQDLYVTNGISRRPNDLDYINYISKDSAQLYLKDSEFVERMPAGEVPDYFFRNRGDLTFETMNGSWFPGDPDLSHGAAYGDLDNDGDLDLVINHINKEASLYRNNTPDSSRYLRIALKGPEFNTKGIGSKVIVFTGGKQLCREQFPARGWLSSVEPVLHFGLGAAMHADSVRVNWPDGTGQVLKHVKANQLMLLDHRSAAADDKLPATAPKTCIEQVSPVAFRHQENDFVPFNNERLMPHAVSTQGPKIATADINHDGLTDFFVGGASGQSGAMFLQQRSGEFKLVEGPWRSDQSAEDTGAAFFDADNDGNADLIVVSAGQEFSADDERLLPRLYLGEGNGHFRKAKNNLPGIFLNASCVIPFDADGDHDMDIFIGGRVVPGRYGVDPTSFLLVNDGKGIFTDGSHSSAIGSSLGMVTDAVPTDLNGDGRTDLIVTGEWMPITVLIQQASGVFQNQTEAFGLGKTSGLWNTIISYDFDKDGDEDFVAGNLGLNSRLKASVTKPVELFSGDIDNNGGYEQILTYYNGDSRFPFVSRDQLVKQVPPLKRKFLKYADFKDVKLEDIVPADQSGKFVHKKAELLSSVFLENVNNKTFIIHDLPLEAQVYPIFGLHAADVNGDGNADILAGGNLFSVQPEFGRYDAGFGTVLAGDGKGHFTDMPLQETGFIIRGEVRDISALLDSKGKALYLVGRNNDTLLVFKQH